ncbi:heme ABC exporter ATP-binding protein CcmA [soil metagenome]
MIKLSIRNLSKYYSNKEVFRDLDFEHSGGKIGIAGSNGAGKSTLLRCLSGLISPSSGSINWSLNDSNYPPKEISSFLGFAAPYVELYEELTARENLDFIKNLRSHQPCDNISDLITRFEIECFADSLYGKLSSGQKQRVKLAAAVIHRPSILCLDEPGTNLDEDGHAIVIRMADNCVENDGIVILASNQPHELRLCDSIVDLNSF